MKIQWRKNVLTLLIVAYATVVAIFAAMVWLGSQSPEAAYEVIRGPLTTLIGGSLAISKDLVPLSDSSQE